MSAEDFKRLGLACESCGELFSLNSAGRQETNVLDMPDPFDATCPHCDQENQYERAAIGVLMITPVAPRR